MSALAFIPMTCEHVTYRSDCRACRAHWTAHHREPMPQLPAIRVQIPAWTDAWMRGDRYGTIVDDRDLDRHGRLPVRMDKSGRVYRFQSDDLTEV